MIHCRALVHLVYWTLMIAVFIIPAVFLINGHNGH